MLTEFRKDKSRKPIITYVVMILSIAVTIVNIATNQFEDFLIESENARLFLLPFHHGFDFTSSILHLIFSVSFFWYFGKIVEKVLGSYHFLTLLTTSYLLYVSLQYVFSLSGYGLTPILFSLVVFVFATMTEAKNLKPRIVHEPYFIRVNSLGIAFMLTAFLLFSFLPVFYDVKNTDILKGIFDGNFLHLISVLYGLILLVFLRRKLRMSWLSFNKRKAFVSKLKSKKVVVASVIIPIGIIFASLIIY